MLKRKSLARIFVLLDSKLSPQRSDLAFINRLSTSHIPFSLVFTKSDKVSQKELSATVKEWMSELGTMMRTMPEYFITTTEKKASTQSLLDAMHENGLLSQ